MVPHCLRLAWQITDFACFLTRWSAGINIAINNAMIAITTRSSINVNPVRNLLVWQLGILIFKPVRLHTMKFSIS
jgi:hypothetical protein